MTEDASLALVERLRADLKTAMREKRARDVSVLRSLIATVDNAQAVPVDASRKASDMLQFGDRAAEVPRRSLSADDVARLLALEIAERREAADELIVHSSERAQQLLNEIEVIERYAGDGG